MARTLKPVQIWGIEFDALIEETKTLETSIPSYPTEKGYNVSDTMINKPVAVSMTLYVTCTPVTWLEKHGNSNTRVKSICDQLEKKWNSKALAKIVTTDTVYTNMGITSMSIKKTKEIGYAREITITAEQVKVTAKKNAKIPSYSLKSGKTKAKAGKATTSKKSKKSTKKKTTKKSTKKKTTKKKAKKVTAKKTTKKTKKTITTKKKASTKKKTTTKKKNTKAKKSASILYGIAKKIMK